MNTIKYVDFQKFVDKFGNLLKEFEVIEYHRLSDNSWREYKRFESGRTYYTIDGQLYFRSNNSLIALNMNFNDVTCGACFQIGSEIRNKRKIIDNQILFICKSETDQLSLQKQSYSDGTFFYTLVDSEGNWKLQYGNKSLEKLIEQLQCEIIALTESEIYQNCIKLKNEVIRNMQQLL